MQQEVSPAPVRGPQVGVRLAPGEVPLPHIVAIREMLFQHGRTIAATATRHASEVRLITPMWRWPAAPLLLLRCIQAESLIFCPVHSDAAELDRAVRRARLALPRLGLEPCLTDETLLVPWSALDGPGRRVLFLPWWPDPASTRLSLAPAAAHLGGGCVLAGVPMRDCPCAAIADSDAWPRLLRPVGAWTNGHGTALILLEQTGSCTPTRRDDAKLSLVHA